MTMSYPAKKQREQSRLAGGQEKSSHLQIPLVFGLSHTVICLNTAECEWKWANLMFVLFTSTHLPKIPMATLYCLYWFWCTPVIFQGTCCWFTPRFPQNDFVWAREASILDLLHCDLYCPISRLHDHAGVAGNFWRNHPQGQDHIVYPQLQGAPGPHGLK